MENWKYHRGPAETLQNTVDSVKLNKGSFTRWFSRGDL